MKIANKSPAQEGVRSGNIQGLSKGQGGRGQSVRLHDHSGIDIAEITGYFVNWHLIFRNGICGGMRVQRPCRGKLAAGLWNGQNHSRDIGQARTQMVNSKQFLRINIKPACNAIGKFTQLQSVVKWSGPRSQNRIRGLSSSGLKNRSKSGGRRGSNYEGGSGKSCQLGKKRCRNRSIGRVMVRSGRHGCQITGRDNDCQSTQGDSKPKFCGFSSHKHNFVNREVNLS